MNGGGSIKRPLHEPARFPGRLFCSTTLIVCVRLLPGATVPHNRTAFTGRRVRTCGAHNSAGRAQTIPKENSFHNYSKKIVGAAGLEPVTASVF